MSEEFGEGAPIDQAHSRQTNEEGGVGVNTSSENDNESSNMSASRRGGDGDEDASVEPAEEKPGSSNDKAAAAADKYSKDPTGDPAGTVDSADNDKDPLEPTGSGNDAPAQGDGDGEYPEQRHAGKVGYGPNYKEHPTMGDRLTGAQEVLKGKIMRKPELAEQGHDRMTGALAEKEQQQDDAEDPFKNKDE